METAEKNRLIVALDVETASEASRLVSALRGVVGMFKVGSQLFTAAGPALVREIVNSGERVFLDLKFHDIPNTVAAAGIEATRLGVSIFNLHAAGGSEMMRRTANAVAECAASEGFTRPLIIAVTVLTSADAGTLAEVGSGLDPEVLVPRLALLAEACLLMAFVLLAGQIPGDSLLIRDAAAALPASPQRDLILALLIAGLGMKAGLVPFHFWMPLAYSVAPTPASAVLPSGSS